MKDIVVDIEMTNLRATKKRIKAERLSNISKMINVWKKRNNRYQFVYNGKFALPLYLSNTHTITMDFKTIENLNIDLVPKGHTAIIKKEITEYSDDSIRSVFIQLFNSFVCKDKDIEEYDKYVFIKVYLKAEIKYDAIDFSHEFILPITNSEVKYLSFVDNPNTTYVTKIFHCTYRDGILKL